MELSYTSAQSKEIKKAGKGVTVGDTKIGCLLWMDDVVLISNNKKEMEEMLKITDDIAKRYHLQFGKDKSQVMAIGKKARKYKFKLGEMILDHTDQYKYLGETINRNLNLEDQIKAIKQKVEAAFQTILITAGDSTFRGIEMEVIWKLVETCIQPIILYAAETWNTTKKEMNQINKIYDDIIKRVLKTPVTTPRETIYIESGLVDIETLIYRQRANMYKKITQEPDSQLSEIINQHIRRGWRITTDKILLEINMEDTGTHETLDQYKQRSKEKTLEYFKEKINREGNRKSKVRHLINGTQEWKPGERKKYMDKMSRNESSTIFKARTRMLDIKNNFRGKYGNMICRVCGQENEDQKHVMEECNGIHKSGDSKVSEQELFDENIEKLRITARKIHEIMKCIEDSTAAQMGGNLDI